MIPFIKAANGSFIAAHCIEVIDYYHDKIRAYTPVTGYIDLSDDYQTESDVLDAIRKQEQAGPPIYLPLNEELTESRYIPSGKAYVQTLTSNKTGNRCHDCGGFYNPGITVCPCGKSK